MTIPLYVSLAVCLIGLVLWSFVDPVKYPKVVEAGHVAFWTGLLAFMIVCSGKHLSW